LIELEDTCAVERDKDDKIRIKQAVNMTMIWRSISQRRKSRKAHLEENNLPLRRLGNAEFPKNVAAENQPTTT
jgi:hypothetical protein